MWMRALSWTAPGFLSNCDDNKTIGYAIFE